MIPISNITDVVELRTWAQDQTYSVSALKEDLEAALPLNEAKTPEDYAREVFEELGQRARLLGAAYPFDTDGVTLSPNNRKSDSSYLFCLAMNFFDDIPIRIRSPEFEGLVKIAAEKYFRGRGIRIGAPWKISGHVVGRKINRPIPEPPSLRARPTIKVTSLGRSRSSPMSTTIVNARKVWRWNSGIDA